MKNLFDKNKKGFTLIELLVAMGVFTLVVSIVSGIFVFSIRQQKIILANQLILDQASYALEYMSRALRMAAKAFNDDCIPSGLNYQKTQTEQGGIKFINTLYENNCQEFYLSSEGEIMYNISPSSSALPLTSKNKLKVTKLEFNISGQNEGDNIQPLVTIYMEIESPYIKEAKKIKIQTSISQRFLDIH